MRTTHYLPACLPAQSVVLLQPISDDVDVDGDDDDDDNSKYTYIQCVYIARAGRR